MDELMLERVRNSMDKHGSTWIEKKMFGGICFMVNDKMCFGTFKDGLMARVGPDSIDELIEISGAEQMVMGTSRPMKGYVIVDFASIESDNALDFWIQKCLEYNPLAKASKKKKKKKK